MKKILSLLLSTLFLFATLSGCQSPQQSVPSAELPFEEYGGYQILNISMDSAAIGAGGNKISNYFATQNVILPYPVSPLASQIDFLGETLQLSFLDSVQFNVGCYKVSVYQITNKPLHTPWEESEQRAIFFEDGSLRTLQNPPISGIDLSGLDDEQIRLKIEGLFAEYVDFSKYTDCQIERRSDSKAELVELIWSRFHGDFTVADRVIIKIYGDILKFFHVSSQMDALPPEEILPSTEELDSILKEYIEDHYEGTGKQFSSYSIRTKFLTIFQGKYAVTVEINVKWLNPVDSRTYGELMKTLILLE